MTDGGQAFVSVPTPAPGVDPRVALATSMFGAPGVYAVLVGSGVSSAAGIATGWQVVQDLIRQIARAEGVSEDTLGDRPEDWWVGEDRGQPRYDTLLAALAPTDPARQMLLRRYFDPQPPVGPINPTEAHRALAWLSAQGFVRVVLTTNFDHLIERALEDAGAAPQVISSESGVAGMTPLVHSSATLIKLHGDWTTLGMRNTPEELTEYSPGMTKLLGRILDEYGLVVIGWSAEYDVALCEAIRSCPSRRYPTYWATLRGDLTERARGLVAQRPTAVIETAGADEFLTDIVQRVTRLATRSVRQARPAPLRIYHFPLEWTHIPQGWAVLPLLQLRSVAILSPAATDTCGYIGPAERDAITEALARAPVTHRLRALAGADALSAKATSDASALPPRPLGLWEVTPDSYQSMDLASYRLGGDATEGISALVSLRLPTLQRGALVFIIDMAVSVARILRLGEVALLWRDGLVLTTSILPEAVASILPTEAEPDTAEIHVMAATTEGDGTSRENQLVDRVDLGPLGKRSGEQLSPTMGTALRLAGALTEHDAGDAVAEAVNQMALNHGYLDPRVGITAVRMELGLPASPP